MIALSNAEVLARLREIFPELPAHITALTIRLRVDQPITIECGFLPEGDVEDERPEPTDE